MTIDNIDETSLSIHSIALLIKQLSTYEKRVIKGSFIDDLNSLIDILDQILLIVSKSINMIYDFRRMLDCQTDIPFRTQLDCLFSDQNDIIQIIRAYRYVLSKLQEEQNGQTDNEK